MTKIVLILFISFFTYFGFAQTNSVVGKWKVVAVDNSEVFYNAKTDSISISSEELKETYTNESEIKYLIDLIKKFYTNNHFEFDGNGIYKWEMYPAKIMEGKYEDDVKRNVIVIQGKNSFNETTTDEISYKFLDGQLYLTMNFTEPPLLLILEKIK